MLDFVVRFKRSTREEETLGLFGVSILRMRPFFLSLQRARLTRSSILAKRTCHGGQNIERVLNRNFLLRLNRLFFRDARDRNLYRHGSILILEDGGCEHFRNYRCSDDIIFAYMLQRPCFGWPESRSRHVM